MRSENDFLLYFLEKEGLKRTISAYAGLVSTGKRARFANMFQRELQHNESWTETKYGYGGLARLNSVIFDKFNANTVNYPYFAVSPSGGYWPSGAVRQAEFGNGLFEFTHQNNRLQTDGFSVSKSPVLSCGSSSNLMQLELIMTDPVTGGNNGNVWRINNYIDNNRTQVFDYDPLNRLTSDQEIGTVTMAWGEQRTFDAWGNFNGWTLTKGSLPQQPTSADVKNRLTIANYDDAGNIIQNGTSFVYDSENRLISSSAGGSYTYNASGQRVVRNGSEGTIKYFYFGGQPVAELNGSTWSDYIFAGSRRVAVSTSTGASDANAPKAASNTKYFHQDQIGSSRLMTSGAFASDNQSWTTVYTPYGFIPNGSIPSHYKFSGKERDTETGLDYFGARYLGSNMGRFMTPDPLIANVLRIINPQRWNLYSYGVGNPLFYVDPDGRDAIAVGFSKLAGGFGHIAVVSVDSNGHTKYGGFGPTGGSKPIWTGHVVYRDLSTKIEFANGKPTQESLKTLAAELATIERQDSSSVNLAYFQTSSLDTSYLDAYMKYAFDHPIRAGYGIYEVTQRDCRDYARKALEEGGVDVPFRTHGLSPNWILETLMKEAAASYSEEKKPKERVTHEIYPCGGENQRPCQ